MGRMIRFAPKYPLREAAMRENLSESDGYGTGFGLILGRFYPSHYDLWYLKLRHPLAQWHEDAHATLFANTPIHVLSHQQHLQAAYGSQGPTPNEYIRNPVDTYRQLAETTVLACV